MDAATLSSDPSSRSLRVLLHPLHLVRNLTSRTDLVWQLTKREIVQRYRGSVLGIVWSMLLPLIMLAIYTLVFGVALRQKFGTSSDESLVDFALLLFCGAQLYAIFSDTVGPAPGLMLANVSYVKRIVFPLEILPFVRLLASVIHGLISFAVLLVATLILKQTISSTLWLWPLVLLPHLMFTLGVSWFLASIGVFVRDVGHIVTVALNVLFFLTPIFYPITVWPEAYRPLMKLNVLTVFVEESRATVLLGQYPDWLSLGLAYLFSGLVLVLGYAWFMKTKRGFADVV